MTFLDQVEAAPDAPAVDDLTTRRTRAELLERALRLVTVLREHGIGPGGHAAQVVHNRVEFVELTLAALLGGVWMTPLNWRLTADEVAHVLVDSGAGMVFAEDDTVDVARAAAAGRPVVTLGSEFEALVGAAEPAALDLSAVPGGSMFYTSGTTGKPKGVKRQPPASVQDALEAGARAGRGLGLDGRGPHLVPGPLYHAAPLGFGVMDLYNGAEMIVMPRFDEGETLRLIDERHVAHTHLVPTMFVRLLRLPEERREAFDGSSVSLVLHGAAPVSIPVKRSMIEWWGPVLKEYWGASEGGVVTLTTSEQWLRKPGTVGRAIPNHEVWAADEDGTRLPPGEVGLLWCRNTAVAEVFEYHDDPEKTAASRSGQPGVYTLGDIGSVDEDGDVFLADRKSHMIISGGVNIYPAEIEHVLAEHPAVADVAVFGVPDDEWGEAVKAAVELTEGVDWSDGLAGELTAFAKEHLAGYKVPRSFDHHDALPREDNGKLYKRRLREPYWAGRDKAI